MARQLRCPTFFFTLSATESKWVNLLANLYKILRGIDAGPELIEEMSFMERASLIREDPVTCACYFDHRF